MARLILLAVVALLLYLVLRAAAHAFLLGLRGTRRAPGARHGRRDQLVKDPVCETYVPQHTAIARSEGAETYYFCSPACAKKFKVSS